MNVNSAQADNGALRSFEEDWNFKKEPLMSRLKTNSRRVLWSGSVGLMDAARFWIFMFSVFALLDAGALSERASAADRQLTPSEVESWFNHNLVDGVGSNLLVRPNVHVTEFIDGADTFQAMNRRISTVAGGLTSIRGEKSYIYLLNWWIDDTFPLVSNFPSTTLSNLLHKASDSRVEIRGMFWNQVDPRHRNQRQVDNINSLAYGSAILDNKVRSFGSHHQKILIIYDAAIHELVAFCGGIDFNRDRVYPEGTNGSSQPGAPDHDVHCMFVGPAAWDLLQIFRKRWDDHPARASLPTAPINKQGLTGINYPRNIEATLNPGHKQWAQIGHTYPPPGPSAYTDWYDFAPHGEQTARAIILHAIAHATNYIYMEDQYMVSPEASRALQAALVKNPKLQLIILIPHPAITSPQPFYASSAESVGGWRFG